MRHVRALSLCLVLSLVAAVFVNRCLPGSALDLLSSLAHAAAPDGVSPQAESPEERVHGERPPPDLCHDCPPGSSCSSYAISDGNDPSCVTGVCDASCKCQARFFDDVKCRDSTTQECIRRDFFCKQGKCEPTETNFAPPVPQQRCWEEYISGQVYARRNNWGLAFPGCTWSESFTNTPKPADTCSLDAAGRMVKTTSRINLAACSWSAVIAPDYPKSRPDGCTSCRADLSVDICDWVADEGSQCGLNCNDNNPCTDDICRVDAESNPQCYHFPASSLCCDGSAPIPGCGPGGNSGGNSSGTASSGTGSGAANGNGTSGPGGDLLTPDEWCMATFRCQAQVGTFCPDPNAPDCPDCTPSLASRGSAAPSNAPCTDESPPPIRKKSPGGPIVPRAVRTDEGEIECRCVCKYEQPWTSYGCGASAPPDPCENFVPSPGYCMIDEAPWKCVTDDKCPAPKPPIPYCCRKLVG